MYVCVWCVFVLSNEEYVISKEFRDINFFTNAWIELYKVSGEQIIWLLV